MTDRTGVRRWVRRAVLGAAAVTGLGVAFAQQPAPKPTTPLLPAPAPAPATTGEGSKTVAIIYGSVAVTQEEFGKFLTDRGGADKIDLYVNKRIIETEAERQKITVTKAEMEASLKQDMDGISVKYEDFVKIVLPKYGKTLYEWMEDVVRPRLLLGKMVEKDGVQVTEEEVKIQYERRFGEKRRVQMILWPLSDDPKTVQAKYAQARKSDDEFDSAARNQPNPWLASSKGRVDPIGKHTPSEDKIIEETAFKLKAGEVSEILRTRQGWVVLKLTEVIPPSKETTFEKERENLTAVAREEKIQQLIPQKFAALKKVANPSIEYRAPTDWQALTPTSGSVLNPGSGGLPVAPSVTPTGGK